MSKLSNSLLVSLLFSAAVVEADSKYPATDFQPKIVYQDTEYKHSGSSPGSLSKAKVGGEVSEADPKYPAANFQPEVLFEDEAYEHKEGKMTSSSASNSAKTTTGNTAKTSTESNSSSSASTESSASSEYTDSIAEEDSTMNLALGLAILAAAGFVFYRKSTSSSDKPATKKVNKRVSKKAAQNTSVSQSASAVVNDNAESGVSGVAKYLESKGGAEPSGVAKYLEENTAAASGVSKYVAKRKVSERATRVATVTGVEKYLKSQG